MRHLTLFFTALAYLLLTPANAALTEDYLQDIFNHSKVKTTLEFGLDKYTPYFLESSTKVISIEFITHGYGPENMKAAIERYKGYSNWIPIAFFTGYHGDVNWAPYRYYGSESVYKATSHQGFHGTSYTPIDDFYVTELGSFINNLKKCYKIDVAFIGGCIYLRGDLVQLLFDKVPVIIGTGNPSQSIYGYPFMKGSDNYEAIYISPYNTTVWIVKKDEYQSLIETLKKYL